MHEITTTKLMADLAALSYTPLRHTFFGGVTSNTINSGFYGIDVTTNNYKSGNKETTIIYEKRYVYERRNVNYNNDDNTIYEIVNDRNEVLIVYEIINGKIVIRYEKYP
jgi:hypothetical protein